MTSVLVELLKGLLLEGFKAAIARLLPLLRWRPKTRRGGKQNRGSRKPDRERSAPALDCAGPSSS